MPLLMSRLRDSATIPASAGIGLRSPHYRDVLEQRPAVGWFEAHSENYFGAGGAPLGYLDAIRRDYPVSLHGVGLSLGSVDPLDERHLARLEALVRRVQPGLVSEHLSWSSAGGVYLNDLAPLPYTQEALDHFCQRVDAVQARLKRPLLIENPSSYLQYRHSTLSEPEFLGEVARRTGAGLLLDINNVYVSCRNHGWDAGAYLEAIPDERVAEFHLAGHTRKAFAEGEILIDTHDQPVCPAVWALFEQALRRIGPRPTLIERDAAIPPLAELVNEARHAQRLMENGHADAA